MALSDNNLHLAKLRRRLPVRLLKEGAWVAVGQMLSAIGTVLTVRIMTELLSPEDFGRLTLLVGLAALSLGLAATPRFQALMRYYADWARVGRVDVVRKVGVRAVAPSLCLAAAGISIGWLFVGPLIHSPATTGLLVAALFVIDGVRMFELSLLNAARRQGGAAVIYAADAWLRPLAAVGLAYVFGASANNALAGYVVGAGVVIAAFRLFSTPEGWGAVSDPDAQVSTKEADLVAAIRRYSLPLIPLAIFGWISGMGDRYVIGGLLDLGQAGLYAAAYGLASRPFLMMSSMIELMIRPILQNAIAANDVASIQRLKRVFLLMTVAGAAAGVLCFVVLSPLVARLLLATEYHSAAGLMPWIAAGYALYVVAIVFSRFCYAFDDTRAVLVQTVTGSSVGIVILLPTIYFGGLAGAAAAVPIRFAVELFLAVFLARRAENRYFSQK